MSVESYQTTIGVPTAPTPIPAPAPPTAMDVKHALAVLFRASLHGTGRGLAGLLRWLRDHIGTFGVAALLLLVQAGDLPNPVTWIHLPHLTPAPTPPGPIPPPVPVVTDKLRVLMLYESAANMTPAQLHVLNSTAIRGYLTARCMADSGRPAWRSWDQDVDASGESAAWQEALTRAKADATSLPKLAIFADTVPLKITPLPVTEADALALLQTYGGH